jgi:formylglycine-generating enzyme required for sulfatase activity
MTSRLSVFVLLCLFGMAIAASAQPSDEGPRVALLIGNASYPDASAPLAHPTKNTRALAEELKRSGFDVDIKENLGKEELQRAFDAFKQKVRPGGVALVFFSGYGLQTGRQTYVIPTNAQVWTENDIRRDGIGIETILSDLNSRGARVKVLILDASRRNPYERRFRSAPAGLSSIDAPTGTLIMSAAAPGKVINEAEGESSVFMGELVKEMRAPGLTAEEIFSRTRVGVSRITNGEQVPWVSSSLTDDFYFNRLPPRGSASQQQPDRRPQQQAVPVPPPPPPAQQQAARPPAPPAQQPAAPPPAQPPPVAANPPRTDAPARPGLKAGDAFRDCGDCPEMVVVPAGEFEMGSNDFEFEKPIHRVRIEQSFAIGRREVSFDEWDQCVAAGACRHRPDDRGQGRGTRPVIDVSWRDAKTYTAWLSQKTGRKYRLPSEAEWEYAARGGTKSTFWWGAAVGNRYANCGECGNNVGRQPMATGSFPPNPFGLYDTAGNAAEWVEDCWNDSYRNAPRDGSAWAIGQCSLRVLRGGAFDSQSRYLRSASRFRYDADVRYVANGFRVVRELP